jgi:oligopeptide transport system permease protein
MRNKIGLSILGLLTLFALLVPLLSPYSFEEIHLADKNLAPSFTHWFGTDDLGRDLATRVAYGLRLSFMIGLLAAILDLIIGVTWGAVSGLCGGTVDNLMMRVADAVYSIPYLLAVIFVAAIIGPGMLSILLAMCLIGWIQMARLVRSQVLQIKEYEYVKAAYALGVRPSRIIFRHILPNISSTMIAMLMLSIPQAIFAEAFLSFLGIGIQPPLASLGSMISDALHAMRFYPWRLLAPACTITLLILGCTLLADATRDTLDPKQRKLIHD